MTDWILVEGDSGEVLIWEYLASFLIHAYPEGELALCG